MLCVDYYQRTHGRLGSIVAVGADLKMLWSVLYIHGDLNALSLTVL